MIVLSSLNNRELVRHTDTKADATPLEKELATRLDEVSVEVEMVQHLLGRAETKLKLYERPEHP